MPWPVKGGVILCLVLSAAAFALYMFGSMPDRGFPDETQFALLQVMRYLALFLTAFSLCALALSFRLMVRGSRLRRLPAMVLYALAGGLGLVLVILDMVIMVAAGGNG